MVGRLSAHQITEQIRQAADLVEVISAYLTLHRAGSRFKARCPFHQEKTPSFIVSPDRQTFKCFGCGVGGDAFKFIQLRENVDFLEARALLAARYGIALDEAPSDRAASDAPGKAELEKVNRWAARWFRSRLTEPCGRAAAAYMDKRGINAASVQRFGLGFAPDSWDALVRAARRDGIAPKLIVAAGLVKQRDDGSLYDAFRNRLMFPIVDTMQRVVGFGGRTLGDDAAKYINSPQTVLFDKGRSLYGLHAAREALREAAEAVVVEGYIDCILANQFGFAGAVATLGTALTQDHVRLLKRYVDRVILVFDSDAAGQRAADQSVQYFLSELLEMRLAHVPEGKDPADYLLSAGAEAFQAVLTSAVGALEFKWKQTLGQCGPNAAVADRRRAVEEFLGLIVRSGDLGSFEPIQRGLILNQVGKLLGVSAEEIDRQLRILARRVPVPRGPNRVEQPEPPVRRAPVDTAAAAMRQVMEVLLNAPDAYESISADYDPDVFADSDLRDIAVAIREEAERGEGWTVAGLISRFESVRTASLIVELQTAGERRSEYAATLDSARAALRQAREFRRLHDLAAAARGEPESSAEGDAAEKSGAALRTLPEAARRVSHFAAPKHRAAPLTVGAPSVGASTTG